MIEDIEVRVGGKVWLIRECSNGNYEIAIGAKILAFKHEGYPAAFEAAVGTMVDEIERELGFPAIRRALIYAR